MAYMRFHASHGHRSSTAKGGTSIDQLCMRQAKDTYIDQLCMRKAEDTYISQSLVPTW